MKLEIEITIGEKYTSIASATFTIEADVLPDADVSAIVTQMLASVRFKAAEKSAKAAASELVAPV
jgi:hypothetical protein